MAVNLRLRPKLAITTPRLFPAALLVGFAVLGLWAQPASPQTAPAGAAARLAAERLTRDTPRTTVGGTTFTAPTDWSISSRDSMVALEPPEADSRMAIVETPAADADAAVAAAWAVFAPGTSRPLLLVTPGPGRNGWQEQRTYTYEVPPNERRSVVALAFRAGSSWTVLLADAAQTTRERRGSQFALVMQSLRPKGYVMESFAGKKAHPLDAARVKQLTAFIETAMKELGIPGVGLSLIDGDQVVFEGGFGVRALGKPAPVDADTLFMIASNTKPLTTLLMARLVDEGKLEWETPVPKIYPRFKIGDAATTAQVRLKHLLCACTGMPRKDFEWLFEFKDATPQTAMETLSRVQPTTGFGELYQYSNLMAAAAGFIAGHVAYPDRELGAAYDEAMRTRIFEPLGMTTTSFDIAAVQRGNHAAPHATDVDGRPMAASMDLNYSIPPVRPAGGAWSSARDLMRYVRLELAGGKLPNGAPLVSEKNLLARRDKQVAIGETGAYGMGLIVDSRWGATVVQHGGSMIGYKSDILMLPAHGVGAVILTNADLGQLLLGPFRRRLLEVLFDGAPEAEENLLTAARNAKAAIAKNRERLEVPADPVYAEKLAARYRSTALGDIAVRRAGTNTVFDFGEWKSAVASRKNDDGTVSFVTIDPGIPGMAFVVAGKTLVLRDMQHEYVFTPDHQ
jgi:CubicO group peptidase (beta-lactamase class C family)